MTSISPERSPAHRPPERRPRRVGSSLVVREMWASLAITAMWVAVVLDGRLFGSGSDIVTNSGVGDIGEHTTVPSAVVVALFAFLGTWVVSRTAWASGPKRED